VAAELRRDFHDRLAAFHDCVEAMAASLVVHVRSAADVLLEGDSEAATRVAAADLAIDAAYRDIENEGFLIVAVEAPVARDLRLVVGSLRVAQELERCGDLASSIARRVDRVHTAALTPAVRMLIHELAAEAVRMLDGAARAYAVLDPDLAAEVIAWDAEMDRLHAALLQALFALHEPDPRSLVELALVARFFERLGDHAAVVAERVRFIAGSPYEPNDADEQPPSG